MSLAAEELLSEALSLDPDARDAFLARIDDLTVREHISSLLTVNARYPEPPAPTAREEEPHPKRVGDFVFEEELGCGGVGCVFLSTDPDLGRPCAVKVLHRRHVHDPERCESFLAEARVLARLNHPNITSVYRFGSADGLQFLVMEYLPGGTLGERLERGPLSVPETTSICLQAAEGLAAAHSAGVIHRDLKPSNVMMTETGEVKLVDFGLASPCATRSSGPATAPALTGSLGYASPEQMRREPPDAASDAWSFGCILYECLTGSPAFGGRTGAHRLTAVLSGEPDWSALPADTPDALRSLLRQLLRRDRETRLDDFSEIVSTLRATSRPSAVPFPPSAPPSSWRRALAGVAILAVVLCGVILSVRPFESGESSRPTTEERVTFSGDIRHAVISPDGAWLAVVDREGQLEFLDRATGDRFTVCRMGRISSPTWSLDSSELFFIGDPTEGGGRLHSYVALAGAGSYRRVGPGEFRGAEPSPDGSRLAGRVFANEELPALGILDRESGEVTAVDIEPEFVKRFRHQWSPVADLLLLSGLNRGDAEPSMWIHDLETGQSVRLLERSVASSACWSPDGRDILFVEDKVLRAVRVDPRTGAPREPPRTILDRFEGRTFSLAGNPDSLEIAYSRGYGSSNLWWTEAAGEWTGDEPWHPLTRGTFVDLECRIDPSGQSVVFARSLGHCRNIYQVRLSSGEVSRLTESSSRQSWPTWSPDGQRIAFAEAGRGVRLLDPASRSAQTLVMEVDASYVYWPPGERIYFQRHDARSANYDVADTRTGEQRRLLASIEGGTLFQASFEPRSGRIAVAGNRGFGDDVRVWLLDPESGSERLLYDGWAAPFAWDESGRHLYMITDDPEIGSPDRSSILILDVETGQIGPTLDCPGHAAGWSSISMSADGRRIVCAIRESRLDAWIVRGVSL